MSWAWWDWPLTWLTNHRPSVLWHCWLGHVTRKIVSEMTYNVSSGTLNSTIPSVQGQISLWLCSHTIVVFPYQTSWQYFDGALPNEWWSRQKSQFSTNVWLHRVLSAVGLPSVIRTAAPDRGKLETLVAGSNKPRLLFAVKGPQCYIKDNRTYLNCMQW